MENKINLLTSEIDGLRKTIVEMRSHFDLEFSKLRAIVNKQNGSTLDHLPHLNQVAANVGNWDLWPQITQNVADKDLQIGHVDEDVDDEGEHLEDKGGNLEDAFDNVVVGNEFENEN
ncbi:hypothetical protein POM88_021993 [Heracleum sosnowskyi]|uniref:Uncharacterized protein n=1 Tax=Heracleum sosnowskyi TaxID=360622 RepID=A0AAD8MUC7_9APIA|nr:hypothetical protein POM88_021993 [Heracleum sosnowskyi]